MSSEWAFEKGLSLGEPFEWTKFDYNLRKPLKWSGNLKKKGSITLILNTEIELLDRFENRMPFDQQLL